MNDLLFFLEKNNLLLKPVPKDYSYKNSLLKLYQDGYISKETYLKILSDTYSYPYLTEIPEPNIKILNIPIKFLKQYKFLPFYKDEEKVKIALYDPKNLNFIGILKQYYPNKKFEYYITTPNDLLSLLDKMQEKEEFNNYIKEIKKELSGKDAQDGDKESGIFKLLQLIIKIAVQKKASDIHIEGEEEFGRIRFRILGTLVNYVEIDKDIYNALVSRTKLLSKMDISNKFTPQDGGFSAKIENKQYDFRVSTLPAKHGESVVIRIFDKLNIKKGLNELGISEENLDILKNVISSPNGIFLVTGPTGSGKSTTLYAILNELDKTKLKIITVEDPIEYELEGIIQVQVNPKKGLTFASSLRAILRQDPDVIMIGEIRDKETLEIAIKAALTGHLVISTLHTNDAVSAISRMIDMGAPPYLVASALEGVEAQRLVKTICPYCKEEYTPSKGMLNMVKNLFPKDFKFYRGKGCERCNFTGFSGRTLLTEIFKKDSEIEDLIAKNASKLELENALEKKGFMNMFFDGIKKVKNGETTLEEVFRVAKI